MKKRRWMPKLSRSPESATGRFYATYTDDAGKEKRKRFATDRTASQIAYSRWVLERYGEHVGIVEIEPEQRKSAPLSLAGIVGPSPWIPAPGISAGIHGPFGLQETAF